MVTMKGEDGGGVRGAGCEDARGEGGDEFQPARTFPCPTVARFGSADLGGAPGFARWAPFAGLGQGAEARQVSPPRHVVAK